MIRYRPRHQQKESTTTMFAAIAICLGASVGALSRWGLGLWLSPGGAIPWGTLAANLIGGYLVVISCNRVACVR